MIIRGNTVESGRSLYQGLGYLTVLNFAGSSRTPTGSLEAPCVLTFVGKKNIINKIPDQLTKTRRKHQEI